MSDRKTIKNTTQEPFEVAKRIWSNPTCMLLVFVGASAEFPVNPAVDWLFYTGRLPADPIARFLSTIDYLKRLIHANESERVREAEGLKALHETLEEKRGFSIPDTSYRDVLCMDTIYSIRSVPLVTGHDLAEFEKDQVVANLSEVGDHMGIPDLPQTYQQLCNMRTERIPNLVRSDHTDMLFASYRRALGPLVFELLISAYPMLVEPELLSLLQLKPRPWSRAMQAALMPACRTGLIRVAYRCLLPRKMRKAVLSWG